MGKRSESEVGGRPRRPEQTPNTTMELSDSELYPMSMARRPPASHPPGGARGKGRRARTPVGGGDVSMWQGMVVRSEDFAPTPKRRKARPWIWIALVGAIGTFVAVYAVVASSDGASTAGAATPAAGPAAAATTPPSTTNSEATKPASTAAAAGAATDSAASTSGEVDAISSAAPIYKAKKSVTKKKTTKKKRVTKRTSKKRRR